MRNRFWRLWFGLLAALAISTLPGLAQGRSHGKGREKARVERRDRVEDQDRDRNRDIDRDGDRDRDRELRGGIFPPIAGPSHRPPGWERGRKTGWGNCNVPPGLAKKEGCRQVIFGRHRRTRRTTVIVLPARSTSGRTQPTTAASRTTSSATTATNPTGTQTSRRPARHEGNPRGGHPAIE